MNERNWVFAINPNFIKPKSQQPDDAYLSYFKLTLFDPPEFIVWNIYGLRHLVFKKLGFKNQSLWQNSFEWEDLKIKSMNSSQLSRAQNLWIKLYLSQGF